MDTRPPKVTTAKRDFEIKSLLFPIMGLRSYVGVTYERGLIERALGREKGVTRSNMDYGGIYMIK